MVCDNATSVIYSVGALKRLNVFSPFSWFEITVMPSILSQITVVPSTFFMKLRIFVSVVWFHHRIPCKIYLDHRSLLMEEGFMGPLYDLFDFRLRSLRYEKDFLSVLSLSQASMVKIFHYSDEWKVVSVAPQRGGCTPPHKSRGVFYTHIGHGN